MTSQPTTAAVSTTVHNVLKPTPAELMEDTGTGLDYGTRPDRMPGFLTPTDRFFIRSHAATPHLDAATRTLRIDGNGVHEPIVYLRRPVAPLHAVFRDSHDRVCG